MTPYSYTLKVFGPPLSVFFPSVSFCSTFECVAVLYWCAVITPLYHRVSVDEACSPSCVVVTKPQRSAELQCVRTEQGTWEASNSLCNKCVSGLSIIMVGAARRRLSQQQHRAKSTFPSDLSVVLLVLGQWVVFNGNYEGFPIRFSKFSAPPHQSHTDTSCEPSLCTCSGISSCQLLIIPNLHIVLWHYQGKIHAPSWTYSIVVVCWELPTACNTYGDLAYKVSSRNQFLLLNQIP